MESLASRRSARVFTPRSSRSVRSSQTGSPVPSTQSPQANSTTPDHQPVVATTWDTTAPSLKIGAQKTGTRTELVALAASAPVSQRHAVAFAMRAGETVVVQGIMDVCVLRGTVCVYEHECTGEWTRVYSPVSHPLVALHARAKDTVGGWDADAERIRGLWGGCGEDGRAGEYPVVVVIRAVDCGLDQIGRVAPAYGGLFAAAGGGGADGQLAQAIGVPGATPVRLVQPGMQLLQTPGDWAAILDQAGTMPLQLDDAFEPTAPVFAVAGPQGLGKSTFARMLVNRLLARFGRVCYMETDLGQSEFAAPGALALTVVREPVTGPPFTHAGQIEPFHAVYMGVVTPKNDPDRYAAAVQRLATVYGDYTRAERARGQDAVVPLVVNTQGWTKGLGLDLLYSLCQEVKPTHYVQAYYPVQAEAGDAGVLPLVDFESIGGCAPQMLWISAMSYERARHAMQQGDGVEVGAGDPAGRKGPRMSPHDMRALALLSLLYASPGRAWNMHRPLAARRALSVPLGDLVFWLGEEDVPPSQLLRALNGTVVGVVCVARAPGAGAHVWTADEVRGLYGADGISDQAAIELSEQGSRVLLRSRAHAHRQAGDLAAAAVPQIVYGQPRLDSTTFVVHAVVRSCDVAEARVNLVLPPLFDSADDDGGMPPLHRVVGLVKGPGPGAFGVELPVWAMLDGGFAERAMGASSGRRPKRLARNRSNRPAAETNVGIQEAPYISVEVDEGVGASTMRAKGGQMRRALQ